MLNETKKQFKIMVVDDNLQNIQILGSILKETKYSVGFATNGKQAIEILHKADDYSLVLLDIDMPILDGYETCTIMRKDEKLKEIPIIFLTAFTEEENIVKGFDCGAQDYVLKPFNSRELLARIDTHIQLKIKSDQLKFINQLLEQKVEARTKELSIALEKADEMNQVKSYFLSNISHEMRTPLISILGFSEFLIEEQQNIEHKEYARHILEGAQRLQTTINSILTMQVLEKKKIEVTPQRFNIVTLIKKIFSKYEKKAVKKKLHIKTIFDYDELWVNSDPSLLEKAIDNLLDNSLKFTKRGGITISCSMQADQNHTFAVIKIADSGIGISTDRIVKIFEPFRQASEGLCREYEGMGLGLHLTRQIVGLLHGQIGIKSEIGKGTIVGIKIPAIPFEKEIKIKVDIRKKTITEIQNEMKSEKPFVLLVEDNEGNCKILNRYLSNDFIVDEAEDGITGIAKAESKQYDLILMDINLGPGIDGVETFQQIREIVNYKSTPVVALTAYAMKEDKQKFLELGFTAYMQKPVVKEELIMLINELVMQSKEK